MLTRLKNEWPLSLSSLVAVLAYPLLHALPNASRLLAALLSAALIALIVGVAIRIAYHAETLAERFGEPYGTMILTLSAVLVETLILAIVMVHSPSPTLARDTIYAAVMLDINGLIGLAALLGGLKHGEQAYNDDSSKTYAAMIMTAAGISMLLPKFLPASAGHAFRWFSIIAMALLYAVFLRLQTGRHHDFFRYSYRRQTQHPKAGTGEAPSEPAVAPSLSGPVATLILGLAITGALAEIMSQSLARASQGLNLPPMLTAIVVALISASPEILTALRAALADRMQPVINIALGASLSTVILTVPAIELLALLQGRPLTMALNGLQTAMLALTLIIAAINLNDGETNAIEGIAHFALFAAFVMLSLLGV